MLEFTKASLRSIYAFQERPLNRLASRMQRAVLIKDITGGKDSWNQLNSLKDCLFMREMEVCNMIIHCFKRNIRQSGLKQCLEKFSLTI